MIITIIAVLAAFGSLLRFLVLVKNNAYSVAPTVWPMCFLACTVIALRVPLATAIIGD